jgi:hypothetical protein
MSCADTDHSERRASAASPADTALAAPLNAAPDLTSATIVAASSDTAERNNEETRQTPPA